MTNYSVGIIMGSQSDLSVMKEAAEVLEEFGIRYKLTILSAHRTPQRVFEFVSSAGSKGIKTIIAGAGMAAHLPGVVAAYTTLPVIGVPIIAPFSPAGLDALLAISQMPPGVPVATVALNGARNAGILAVQILATADENLAEKLMAFKDKMRKKVEETADKVEKDGFRSLL